MMTEWKRPQSPERTGGVSNARGIRRRRALIVTGVAAVLGAALLGGAAVKAARDASVATSEVARFSPPPFVSPSPRATGPLVVVIGDDSAGAAAAGVTTWPTLVETATGGRVEVAASQGAGYTTSGTNGRTFEEAVASAPTAADIVVFIGGAADASVPKVELAKAASSAFAAVAKRSPVAQILVVGPVVRGDATAGQAASVSGVLRGAARLNGLDYADPSTANWLPGKGDVAESDDLDSADERAIALRVEQMIREARN